MIPWLVGALGAAAAVIVALVWRGQRDRARDEVELWKAQAERRAEDIKRAGDQLAREQGARNVLLADMADRRGRMGDLARLHPEHAGQFLRWALEDAAGGGNAPVPGEPAAPDPRGGGNGGR